MSKANTDDFLTDTHQNEAMVIDCKHWILCIVCDPRKYKLSFRHSSDILTEPMLIDWKDWFVCNVCDPRKYRLSFRHSPYTCRTHGNTL